MKPPANPQPCAQTPPTPPDPIVLLRRPDGTLRIVKLSEIIDERLRLAGKVADRVVR